MGACELWHKLACGEILCSAAYYTVDDLGASCRCCSLEFRLKKFLKTDFVLRFTQESMEIFTSRKFVFCLHEDVADWQVFLAQYSLTVLDRVILII